jgi:hypothetical protein
MQARLLLLPTILALTLGCAPGHYDTQPAYQPEDTPKWYKNPETEQEYQRRLWWENYESEWPRFHRWR